MTADRALNWTFTKRMEQVPSILTLKKLHIESSKSINAVFEVQNPVDGRRVIIKNRISVRPGSAEFSQPNDDLKTIVEAVCSITEGDLSSIANGEFLNVTSEAQTDER